METAPRVALRRPELVTDSESSPTSEPARSLTVTAVYELSEAGRKASLLSGGDGKALQQLKVQIPTGRLHLVAVDPQGTARLKLRPRFEMDAEHCVVRFDKAPIYDAPPSLEDLFRDAARNHELERVYQAERNLARSKRREAERERRAQVAESFLADKSQRALVHPAPSPRRCTLVAAQGRMLFDVATDEGVARDVPAEAHRRFRADLAAKKEKNLRERAAQLALHEEKKRFIAEWIEKHGTPDQKERFAAGVLPIEEAVEAITDWALAPVVGFVRYKRDGAERLQNYVRNVSGDPNAVVRPADLIVKTVQGPTLTARQWDLVKQFRALLPEASIALRQHVLSSRHPPLVPPVALVLQSALVSCRVGPLSVRREYLADPGDASVALASADRRLPSGPSDSVPG